MAFQHYCQCLYIKTFEGKGFQSSHCRHPPNNRWNLSTLAFILLLWNHVKAFRAPFFFLIRIFFTDTDDLQDSRGREGTIFYSTLPLPPAHEHWDIYLQLCMWDEYHVFLIATLVFTRLLHDEIHHLFELPFEWLLDDAMFVCLLDELILDFCYSDLTLETWICITSEPINQVW